MAFNTAKAAVHMDGVVKENKIRRAMNLHPTNRVTGLSALSDGGQARIVFENLVMAIEARGRGGDVRIPRFLDAIVAITAIDAELIGVNRMRERNRLNGLISDARVFGSEVVPDASGNSGGEEQAADDDERRQSVRPFWKDI